MSIVTPSKRKAGDMSTARGDAGEGGFRRRGVTSQNAIDEIGEGVPVVNPPNIPRSYANHFTVELPYNDRQMNYIQSTSSFNHIYRMTSIFDPDFTGVGSQPYQRDTYASLYNYYTVIKCHYEILVYNGSSSAYVANGVAPVGGGSNRLLQATIRRATNAGEIGGSTNTKLLIEQKYNETKFIPEGEYRTFTGTLTHGDWQINNIEADNDRVWTAVGSNPAIDRLLGITVNRAFPLLTLPDDGIPVGVIATFIYETQFNDYANRLITS